MSEEVGAMSDLQSELEYEFANEALLLEALTHSTYANENPEAGAHNERLEFLGDAVLGLMSAQFLLVAFPSENEGSLSQRRSRTVSNHALSAWGEELGLGRYLRLGHGQHQGDGGVPGSLLADTVEALIGAVYLDGGLEAAAATFGGALRARLMTSQARADFKTRLQEYCHRRGDSNPVYSVCDRIGPDHAPTFTCAVAIGGEELARAKGNSKSEAQQEAAREVLVLRKEEDNDAE
jgi:ribonuclease-3